MKKLCLIFILFLSITAFADVERYTTDGQIHPMELRENGFRIMMQRECENPDLCAFYAIYYTEQPVSDVWAVGLFFVSTDDGVGAIAAHCETSVDKKTRCYWYNEETNNFELETNNPNRTVL